MGWGDTDPRPDDPEGDFVEFGTPSDVLLNIDVGYLLNAECGTIWDGGLFPFLGVDTGQHDACQEVEWSRQVPRRF